MPLKIFTNGEVLFDTDLNGNFAELLTRTNSADTRLTNLETPATQTLSGAGTVNLDFAGTPLAALVASGNITFTGSNYQSGRSKTVRIGPDSEVRTLSFPGEWVFVGTKPTELAAGETLEGRVLRRPVGILTLTCFGSSANDVVAAWASEEG
jgi:hypothetical protein